jgi:hypothetical protein
MSTRIRKVGDSVTAMTFPAAAGALYLLAPRAKQGDVVDQLAARLAQLEALLSVTYGGEGAAFRGMSAELQDGFMWACSSLASEARQLFRIEQDMQQEGEA